MSKTKSFWLKILGIVLVGAVLSCIAFLGIWLFSDRIARVSYYGHDNMFNVHEEYLAFAGPLHVRVPEALAQSAVSEKISNIGKTDKEAGRNYFVQVCWSENTRPLFEGTTTLIHAYSAKYVFEVKNPGPEKIEVTRDEEKKMLEIAEHFHDFKLSYVRRENNWVAISGNFHTTLFSYNVYFNGEKTFFCIHQPGKKYELYSYDNGKFLKVYTVPEKGDFDLVIWKGLK